jgi:hypothetical protein
MPREMKINNNPELITDKGFTGSLVSKKGLFDDPLGFGKNVAEGALMGAGKLVYDSFAVGVDAGNFLLDNNLGGVLGKAGGVLNKVVGSDQVGRLDVGADYWDAISSVHDASTYVPPNNQVQGWANTTALMGTTAAAFSRLAKLPKFAPLMQSSSKWTQLKGSLYAGSLAEIPAALIHTRASDESILSFLKDDEDPNVFVDWWLDRSENPEIEGRFRHALEGMVLGAAFEGSLSILGNMFRSGKKAAHDIAEDTGDLLRSADEVLGTGDGTVILNHLQERSVIGQAFQSDSDAVTFLRNHDATRARSTDSENLFTITSRGKQRTIKSKKKRHLKKLAKSKMDDVRHPEFDREYAPLAVPRIIHDQSVKNVNATGLKLTRAERKALKNASSNHYTGLDLGDLPVIPSVAKGSIIDDTASVGIVSQYGADAITLRAVDNNTVVSGSIDEFLSVPQRTYIDEPAPSAAAARSDINEYNAVEIQRGQPTEDLFNAPVDVANKENYVDAARMTNANAEGAEDIAREIIASPLSTAAERERAQMFIDDSTNLGLTRLQIPTSGDDHFKRGVRLAQVLKIKTTFRGDAVPKRSVAQLEYDTAYNLSKGKLGIKTNQLAAELAIDPRTLRRQLANLVSIMPDAEEIITAVRMSRHRKVGVIERLAKTLETKGLLKDGADLSNSPEFAQYVDEFLELDEMDWGLQGVIGSAGRILRMQQENPSTMGNVFRDLIEKRRIAKMEGTPEPLAELTGNLSFFTRMIEDPDQMLLKAHISRVAKGGQLRTVKNVSDLFKGKVLFDWFKAIYIGGLLSSPRTLISSVGISGTIATFWKQIAVKSMEGLIGSVYRSGGARLSDPLIAASVGYKQSLRLVQNLFAGKNRKGLNDLFHVALDSAREGVEDSVWTHKEVLAEISKTADNYAANDMYKLQKVTTLIQPLLSVAVSGTNLVLRGIRHVDDTIKGLNNMMSLEVEANRVWRREGGQKLMPNVTKEQFVDKFMDYQQKVFDIDKMKLTNEQSEEAILQLFDGNDQLMQAVSESIEVSQKQGMEATLQQSTEGTFANSIFKAVNNTAKDNLMAKTAVLAVAPFQKTPVNLLTEVIDHSPMAIFTKRFRADILEGTPQEKLQAFAKVTTGVTLQAGAIYLAASGRIQGTVEPKDRAKLQAQGITENSMFIAGTWYDYSKLGPLAVLITAASNVNDLQNKDVNTTSIQLLGQTLAVAGSESHLRIFKEIIDVAQDPNATGAMADLVFKKATAMLTPASGIVTTFNDIVNRKKYRTVLDREIGGLYGQMQADIAHGLRSNAIWRLGSNVAGGGLYAGELDVLGDDVYAYGESNVDKFLHLVGIGTSDHKKSPFMRELVKHNMVPSSSATSTIHGIPLTSNEQKEIQRQTWQGKMDLAGDMDKIVTSDAYTNSATTTASQKKMLQASLHARKKFVKQMFFEGSPRLKQEKFLKQMQTLQGVSTGDQSDYESEADMMDARGKAHRAADLERFRKEFNMRDK